MEASLPCEPELSKVDPQTSLLDRVDRVNEFLLSAAALADVRGIPLALRC